MMVIQLTSPTFKEGEPIPVKYTCDGENTSPALAWNNVPQTAKSLALICDDPDAPRGTWVHWVVYNMPVTATGLPEAVPIKETIDNNAQQGLNDSKHHGYDGPCPPSGTHHYYFKIYALDTTIRLSPKEVTKATLLKAMEGHIIAQGQLMGTYQKK